MPAYNFKKEFAEAVENGTKRQTIRAKRKRETKPGEMLYLYTGMRTKECRRLRTDVCMSIEKITITDLGLIMIDGKPVRNIEIAQADGFSNVTDFFNFFRSMYGLPFAGELIKW